MEDDLVLGEAEEVEEVEEEVSGSEFVPVDDNEL